ncbi:cobalamin-binding protein [Azoarcus indigens]|nr:cobalamin-binding protein [Azoarcus indigens]
MPGEVFGFLRHSIDAHTLGISYVARLIEASGHGCVIGDRAIVELVGDMNAESSSAGLYGWVKLHRISRLGFSFRLDPHMARDTFGRLYHLLHSQHAFADQGGQLRAIYFAGLPEACALVRREFGERVQTFEGDESPAETLARLGIPEERMPAFLQLESTYDNERMRFAREVLEPATHLGVGPVDRSGGQNFGTRSEHLLDRVDHGKRAGLPPLMRVHVGPFGTPRETAVAEFLQWSKRLAAGGLLDILSIGTSQLTQSNFGEEWGDRPNGGGVPINSEEEYTRVWDAARPMLVRTYAGTRHVRRLAEMHERTLNIAWHALSLWWFCQIDGRGENTVHQNLTEHLEAIRSIAASGKPLEANVPHHFAFRGADDISYVLSAYLAARTAKRLGIRSFVLQNMLNTPKYTSGLSDLAKSRAMLRLVRTLEDKDFRVILQPRAGLDYFSPNLDRARVQLAASALMMDDIEPDQPESPPIIHVVSYSEAAYLADPPVIEDSIRIVRGALDAYRGARKAGQAPVFGFDLHVEGRAQQLLAGAQSVLAVIEREIADPYTVDGLYRIFAAGFLPVPYLWEGKDEFRFATAWETALVDGGVSVVDARGVPVPPAERAELAASRLPRVFPPLAGSLLQGLP